MGFLDTPTSISPGIGSGDALTTSPLSQFAGTSSAQLKGVLTDETGSGAAVFANSPALITPTGVVKGDVGLGNVDNTADAAKNVATAAALATPRTIDGVSFSGGANITTIAEATHAATGKTTPVDADELSLVDSGASNVLKKLTWANLKATAKTYFDTLYTKASGAEVDTGTDDVKFTTAKAINDSHNVPDVAPGTNGNIMTSNGTDWGSAAPTAATVTPRQQYSTMFESAGRFTTSLTGTGAVTFDTGGVKLSRGTTASSVAVVYDPGALPGITTSALDWNPSIWFDIDPVTNASGSWSFYIEFGYGNSGVISSSRNYIGLKLSCAAGVLTAYAANANGTAETLTAFSSGLGGSGNASTFMAQMNGSTNIKYYYNHVLVATNTTNLPSGFGNGRWAANMIGTVGTNDQAFYLRGLGYSYDVA